MLDLNDNNVAENFREWKDHLDIFNLASSSNKKDKKFKKLLFLIVQDHKL